MDFKITRYSPILGFLLLFAITFPIYKNLIIKDPMLIRDDNVIYLSIKKVHSLADYIRLFKSNEILDIQPVRDLFIFCFWKIEELTGLRSFHLYCLIIFSLFLSMCGILISRYYLSPLKTYLFLSLICIHPTTVASVAWISSIKHLLSALFLILGFIFVINHRKNKITSSFPKATAFYMLSTLSHPIHVLTHFLQSLFIHKENKKKFLLFVIFFILGGLFIYANNLKYQERLLAEARPTFYFLFDTLGRTFYQSLGVDTYGAIPIMKPENSKIGWIVFSLFTILHFFAYRRPRKSFLLYLFILLPTVVSFRYYYYDTYALIPTVSIFLIFFLTFTSLKGREIKIFSKFIYLAFFCIFYVHSFSLAKTWMSDDELWSYSFTVDKTWLNGLFLCMFRVKKNPEQVYDLLLKIKTVEPETAKKEHLDQYDITYAIAVFMHPKFSNAQKIDKMLEMKSKNDWYLYVLASLYLEGGRSSDALASLKKLKDFRLDNESNRKATDEETYIRFQNIIEVCQSVGGEDCKKIQTFIEEKFKAMNIKPKTLPTFLQSTTPTSNLNSNSNLNLNFQ
ncbi:MAG: hypothetical protein QE271_13640 [Bacteriovoracaceae bacterium]|nr:hypothetical protein [Bacteriovoracaceae bacterium]